MDSNNKRKKLTVIFILLIMLFVSGISYAFFTANTSNANNQTAQIDTGNMRLTFSDNDNGVSASLSPGESVTKKFTIQNTGSLEAYGIIKWLNLVNTYMSSSLSYDLSYSTSENGSYTNIKSGNVPSSTTAITSDLSDGLIIPVNTTYYYKLTITLNNLSDINQESDLYATMNSKFTLVETQDPRTAVDYLMENVIYADFNYEMDTDYSDGLNYYYKGNNPSNYVDIGDTSSLWRIIGIFNDVDNGEGTLQTRVKIIRASVLGQYSWDTSDSSINLGWGINEWSQSDLMTELNSDYLNTNLSQDTMWYSDFGNARNNIFDHTKVLSAHAQNLIGDAVWYTGTNGTSAISTSAPNYFNYERSNNTQKSTYPSCNRDTCNDSVARTTSWIGKIGLMYPSDYGYAVDESNGYTRQECVFTDYTSHVQKGCDKNNWLKQSNLEWTIMPVASSVMSSGVYYLISDNMVMDCAAHQALDVRPVAYLKANVKISGGTGTESDPYIIS